MLKFFEFMNEAYDSTYHENINPDFIEDIYQYMFDIGFRLCDDYDDDEDQNSLKYGKSDFKEYLIQNAEYGFKTNKGINITDNIQTGSRPAISLNFYKNIKSNGKNQEVINYIKNIGEFYKEISNIISKLNKKEIDVELKQTIKDNKIIFSFILSDKNKKIKNSDLNFRITKTWQSMPNYVSIEISDDDISISNVDFRKGNELGIYIFELTDDHYNIVHRDFKEYDLNEFRQK